MLRIFAYLSLMGWPGIYSVYYSQLEGSKDSSHWMRYFLPLSDFSKRY